MQFWVAELHLDVSGNVQASFYNRRQTDWAQSLRGAGALLKIVFCFGFVTMHIGIKKNDNCTDKVRSEDCLRFNMQRVRHRFLQTVSESGGAVPPTVVQSFRMSQSAKSCARLEH